MRDWRWKKLGLLLAIVLGSGVARFPLEAGLLAELRAQGFHPKSHGSDLGGQVGVQGAVGLLGGLRYMVAAFLELQAFKNWEPPPRWDKLSEAYRLVNLLQPKNVESWETAAWHHIYNASGYYRYDDKTLPPLQRELLAHDYEERGLEILKTGIQWNPEDVGLRLKLADAYQYKLHNPCLAAENYRAASELPGAPKFCYRFYGYSLAKCPGKEREALEVLKRIYKEGLEVFRKGGPLIWKPTLIVEMNRLERELAVPWPDRIPERFDDVSLRIASPLLARKSYPIYRQLFERVQRNGDKGGTADPQLIHTIRALEKSLGIPQEERLPPQRVEEGGRK